MASDADIPIAVVPSTVFLEKWAQRAWMPTSVALLEKCMALVKNEPCFNEEAEADVSHVPGRGERGGQEGDAGSRGWGGGGYGHGHRRRGDRRGAHQGASRGMQERPRIGARDLSKSDMLAKDFRACLNKLTQSNLEYMLDRVRKAYNGDHHTLYWSVLWKIMVQQTEFHALYFAVLECLLRLHAAEGTGALDVERRAWSQWTLELNYARFLDESPWTMSDDQLSVVQACKDSDNEIFNTYLKQKKEWMRFMQTMASCMHHRFLANDPHLMQTLCDALQTAMRTELWEHLALPIEGYLDGLNVWFAFHPASVTDAQCGMVQEWCAWHKHPKLPSLTRFKMERLLACIGRSYVPTTAAGPKHTDTKKGHNAVA